MAATDGRGEIRDQVEAGRRRDFGIPDIEAALTVVLRLPDMEDFVLGSNEKSSLPL